MSFEISNELDPDLWRAFVQQHPQGNIFHMPEMYQLFAATANYRPALWVALDRQRKVQALFTPVSITLLGGLLSRPTTRTVSYGSVLCRPGELGEQALRVLLEQYLKATGHRSLFTELRNLADLRTIQPLLQEVGFAFEPHLNYHIDLNRPPQAILQDVGKNTRKRIRQRMRRADVIIEQVADPAGLAEWYGVLEQTYHHARVPVPDRSLFEAAFRLLVPAGMARFYFARVDSAMAAVSLKLFYKGVVYAWYGGTDREFGRFAPNEFMTWQVLKSSAEQKYRLYDFGGAGSPDQAYGVRDFKAKFGGCLVDYGRNICVHAPIAFKVSKVGYQLVRGFLAGH